MRLRSVLLVCVAVASGLTAATPPAISPDAFRDADAKAAMQRLKDTSDEFKDALEHGLDNSMLNGSVLEDRLNQWANLLKDEIDSAAGEFKNAAEKTADVRTIERFAGHWGNAMMAATAINRAMIRRGFAQAPEQQWSALRNDLNRVAHTLGRPTLPDMTAVVFRSVPASTLAHPDVTQVMKDLRASSDRFEDKLEHAWFITVGPNQRRVLQRWADDLESATSRLLEEYKNQDSSQFQTRLEECLMLAAGLNRAMLVNSTSAVPQMEWNELRGRLNTLATRFGYPLLEASQGHG